MKSFTNISNRISRTAARLFCIALVSGMAVSAQAQEPLRIAVLDMTAALFNSELAKQVDQQLKEQTSADEQKIKTIADQATKLQEKLQKDSSVMSDDEKRKASEELEELGVQYQFLVQKLQKLVEETRQQFQQTYAPNLVQAIQEVLEAENYDLIFRSNAILHYNSAYDITARVTEKLNAQ